MLLTDRSLRDIISIEHYSVKQWGKKVAVKYLSKIENALILIQRDPEILWQEEGFHPFFQFYNINKHLLVFDVKADELILLTVFHSAMDISSRLAKLQPTLSKEVELLHHQLRKK